MRYISKMLVNLAFGSTLGRFDSKAGNTYFQLETGKRGNPRVGPGSYNPKTPRCYPKDTKSPWTRKVETEEFSKRSGGKLQVQPQFRQTVIEKTSGGPGVYDIPRDTFKNSLMPQNTGFSTSQRHDPCRNDYPSAGTYCADIFKYSSVTKKCFSKIPPFEWDGFRDRFQTSYEEKCKLPPNIYKPKDATGIEALLNKVVSKKRGPYDCFTGPRDGSTVKNHFAVMMTEGADCLYDRQGDLDVILNHPSKKYYGVLYKPRVYTRKEPCKKKHEHNFCYVEQEEPGPTTYDINWHTIKKAKRSKVAFGSSSRGVGLTMKPTIYPGPGRYFFRRKMVRKKKPSSTIFESKELLNALTRGENVKK